MTGFTDLHQHVLWALDDGARTLEETLAMLRASVRDGARVIAATPHALPGVRPFDLPLYEARLAQVRALCRQEGLPLQLLSGAEIHYTPMTERFLKEKKIPTLGGTEYALIEFSPDVSFNVLQDAANSLCRGGYVPIFAHVERYACFRRAPGRAVRLRREWDIRYQVNAGSLFGGLRAHFLISRLLSAGAVDLIASDAHDCAVRPPDVLRAAYERLCARCSPAYASALVHFDVQSAMPDEGA